MENQNKGTPVPKYGVSGRMLIVFGVCVLIWLPFLFSGGGNSPDPQPKEKDYSTMAYIQSKAYVKSALKSPTSADFPYMDYQMKDLGDNRFVVSSYVDSQNSFGVMIRSNWVVTVQYLGGDQFENNNWKLEAMTIDGKRVYP